MPTNTRTKLILAGPGAGKTHDLVFDFLDYLPNLRDGKTIAIITYTNAATDKIKKEIYKKIGPSDKLFIGTIHSFLNRYVLLPYSSVFGITPSDVQFIDDYNQTFNKPMPWHAANRRSREAGIITFDQIEYLCQKLVCGGEINRSNGSIIKIRANDIRKIVYLISCRVQAIFVDEYQDATAAQHKIFSSLRRDGKIDYLYCVGDSEQYIYSFRYGQRFQGIPKFDSIPIMQLSIEPNIEINKKINNYRSSNKIVSFLNNFSEISQKSVAVKVKELDVFFISKTLPEEAISEFVNLTKKFRLYKNKKLFLTYSNKLINWQSYIDVKSISNSSVKASGLLSVSINYITSALKISQKKIKEKKDITDLELRTIGMKLIRTIKTNPFVQKQTIDQLIVAELGIAIPNVRGKGEDNLNKIRGYFLNKVKSHNGFFSTIHKAKGLQATSVLVIAENIKELNKWIEIDRQKRNANKLDECRLGYVAFSRAKSLLCIACLEQIDQLTKDKLEKLGVVISN